MELWMHVAIWNSNTMWDWERVPQLKASTTRKHLQKNTIDGSHGLFWTRPLERPTDLKINIQISWYFHIQNIFAYASKNCTTNRRWGISLLQIYNWGRLWTRRKNEPLSWTSIPKKGTKNPNLEGKIKP